MKNDEGSNDENVDDNGRSIYGRNITYTLSSGRIEFLRQNHSDRTFLTEQLGQQGFRVSFNFDQQEVNIESETARHPRHAIQYINENVVETELPANAFVRTDRQRQTTDVIYLRNRIENTQPRATDTESITTKFRCKRSEVIDALNKEAQVTERKYNCHITYTHPRLKSPSEIQHPVRGSEANIEVLVAEIQDLEVDVIVNSTNAGLNLNVGKGVSKILLKTGGQRIQDELQKEHPRGIQFGEVAKSGSGNMKNCKAIYHATMPLFPQIKTCKSMTVSTCFQALASVILKVLLMASSDGWKSVAFPALGTGNLGYPVKEVVQIMFLAVSQFFESSVSPIEKVFFVIYPKAEPLLKQLFLLEKYSWQLKSVKVDETETAHREIEKDPSKICETRFVIGKTYLQISNGNIETAFDTSNVILLLWQDEHLKKTKEHPVLSCMDPSVQNSFHKHYASFLHDTKVSEDKSSWEKARLIHSYCKSDTEDVIVRAIQRGLKTIEKDVTTVVLPVRSDGSKIWQPHIAAGLIVKSVQGLNRLHHVIRINIQDGHLLEPFLTAMSDNTNCTLHRVPDVSNVFDTIFSLDPCQLAVGDIETHVSSDSEEKNQRAAKELKDALGIKLLYMIKEK